MVVTFSLLELSECSSGVLTTSPKLPNFFSFSFSNPMFLVLTEIFRLLVFFFFLLLPFSFLFFFFFFCEGDHKYPI